MYLTYENIEQKRHRSSIFLAIIYFKPYNSKACWNNA